MGNIRSGRPEDCPCRTCTKETGRASPVCRTKECPHDWFEWQELHKAEKDAKDKQIAEDCVYFGVRREGYRRSVGYGRGSRGAVR